MIGNYTHAEVHKSHRRDKLANKKEKNQWRLTPPKSVLKKSIFWVCGDEADRLGYDFDEKTACKKLKWMKQEFEDKVFKYYGNRPGPVRRMTCMDKVKRKEELNFKMEANPILQRFSNIDRMIEDKMKRLGL